MALVGITETVDTNGYVGDLHLSRLRQYWNPHISYFDNTNGDLKYACMMAPVGK